MKFCKEPAGSGSFTLKTVRFPDFNIDYIIGVSFLKVSIFSFFLALIPISAF